MVITNRWRLSNILNLLNKIMMISVFVWRRYLDPAVEDSQKVLE